MTTIEEKLIVENGSDVSEQAVTPCDPELPEPAVENLSKYIFFYYDGRKVQALKGQNIPDDIDDKIVHDVRKKLILGYYAVKREELNGLNDKVDTKYFIRIDDNSALSDLKFEFDEAYKKDDRIKRSTSTIEILKNKYKVPTLEETNGFYISPEIWEILLFNLYKKYNTMLVGDSGYGKTEIFGVIGRHLNKKVTYVDMGSKQDPISTLIGVHRFANGRSYFDRSSFSKAIESPGIVVLDELPRAPMNSSNILFPVLDSRRVLHMDIAVSGERSIPVHEGVWLCATANVGYRYTGNNVIDAALAERFKIVKVTPPPFDKEVEILCYRTGINTLNANAIVNVCSRIRDMFIKEEIQTNVSLRHSLYIADLVQSGFKMINAFEIAIIPHITDDQEIKIIRDFISSV